MHLRRCESPPPTPHVHLSSLEEESDRDIEDEVGADYECTLSNPKQRQRSEEEERNTIMQMTEARRPRSMRATTKGADNA
jgi:hypothetical protein